MTTLRAVTVMQSPCAVPYLEGWLRLADEYGVPLRLETHRNTLSNDLWVLHEILDRVPQLPLLADLSHYVCGQEMNLPITPVQQAMIERILDHTQALHGRVASAEQIQLELGFEIHQPWVEQFLRWWQQGFERWLQRAGATDSLTFTCELGPPPYAIVERDGRCRSNRWDEALLMRELVQQCWERARHNVARSGPT